MTASMSSRPFGLQSFLIVFDFDDTVVNCNTDTAIPEFLHRGDFQRKLLKSDPDRQRTQWTNLMDAVLAPFGKEELAEAARQSVKMDPHMPDLFRFLTQLHASSPSLLEIAIASDANVHFIESVIAAQLPFAREAVSQIHSNLLEEVESNDIDAETGRPRRCRLRWYEANGHDCVCCNSRNRPNMCKSRIIARLLHGTRLIDPTVIFIGDGANDLCPVLNILRPRDYMFARRDFPVHQCLSTPEQCGPGGCCNLHLWSDAQELQKCFEFAMSPARRLPGLVRFRDAGPAEFRVITLAKRIPQVLERTLEDNAANTVPEGREKLLALAEATRINGPVAVLPGISGEAPAWLSAFARVAEFDTPADANSKNCKTANDLPRWGQMPWLQGEVYFYNLVAQYLLLAGSHNNNTDNNNRNNDRKSNPNILKDNTTAQSGDAGKETWQPNLVTPYVTSPPISTATDCKVAGANGMTTAPGATAAQRFNPTFLTRENIDANGNGSTARIPPNFFQPYRDYFAREKHEVLRSFLRAKICPMLACQPWDAGDEFVDVLLRWMLWGNGIDLSMFTLEQLQGSHAAAAAAADRPNAAENATDGNARLAALRAAEESTARAQDAHVIGNNLDKVAELVRRIVHTEPDGKMNDDKKSSNNNNNMTMMMMNESANFAKSIDIVMDNVGVECVADLIFCLWVFRHHPTLYVTLHVKCMAYYVSDVTPPDFDFLLHTLNQCTEEEPGLAPVLLPFVKLLREAFDGGRLRVDADVVWTQPCEYRELPPRVVNTFFYTQHISSSASSALRRVVPRSALVIFKGDLNFRRLIGDRHWDGRAFLSTLSESERAAPAVADVLRDTDPKYCAEAPPFQRIVAEFWPTAAVPVCAVRTVKSEGTVGVTAQTMDKLDRTDATWKTSGKYGVVLLASGEN